MATGPIRERGLKEMVRSVRSCARARGLEQREAFDERHGTDTEHTLSAADLDATGPDVPALWRYWPTLPSVFAAIMEDVPVRCEGRVFVDLGSGKGRVPLMASEYPFRKIVGVELSPALHEIAERNLRLWRSPTQRCHDIELVCMDARDFEMPADDTLLYLFQPFPADVMSEVLGKLGRSLSAHPRIVDIVYNNPVFDDLFSQAPFLELRHWRHATERDEFDWAIYRTKT